MKHTWKLCEEVYVNRNFSGLSGRARKHPSNVLYITGGVYLTDFDIYRLISGKNRFCQTPKTAAFSQKISYRVWQNTRCPRNQSKSVLHSISISHACSTIKSFRAKCFCNPGTNLMLLSRANSRNSFCHYFWRNLTQYKFGIRDRRATRSRVSEIHKLLISVVQNHVLF